MKAKEWFLLGGTVTIIHFAIKNPVPLRPAPTTDFHRETINQVDIIQNGTQHLNQMLCDLLLYDPKVRTL